MPTFYWFLHSQLGVRQLDRKIPLYEKGGIMAEVSLQNGTTLLSGRHAGFDWFRSAPCPDLLHSWSRCQFGRDLGDQESITCDVGVVHGAGMGHGAGS